MRGSYSLDIGMELGHYTIVKQLGKGGFGITYLVQDRSGEQFVIKELFIGTDNICSRTEQGHVIVQQHAQEMFDFALSRFVDEAKILEKIHHNAIVKVNEHFFANGTAYYVMEYLSGQSLEDEIKSHGKLSLDETIKFVFPILEAIKEMHKLGLWHRDIKPANIMISNGRSVLIDFGTVKVTDAKVFNLNQGVSMFAAYSKTFAAPEQKEDLNLDVDHRTDIYSLGATIFYMIMGKPICSGNEERFYGGNNYVRDKLTQYDFSDVFKKVIEKSMEIDKKNRPQSISDMQKMILEDTAPYIPKDHDVKSPEKTVEKEGFWTRNWYLVFPMVVISALIIVLFVSDNTDSKMMPVLAVLLVIFGIVVLMKNITSKSKGSKYLLTAKCGDERTIVFEENRTYTIGRDPGCDIVVSGQNSYVSRKHLSITCCTSGLMVTELKATQGTYIEHRKLEPNHEYVWQSGEVLSLVDSSCVYVWEYQ